MKSEILKVGFVVFAIISIVLIGACAPPETVTAPPGGTVPPPTLSPEKVIKDLAYIKILVSGYSDDPDPQEDGITLDIMFYDSKSEPITFYDIPVTVTIELYGYREVLDTFDHEKMELIYQAQVTVDHSMRMSEMFGKYIRIPFENIMVDQNKYYEFGTIKVIVITPKQGNFEAIQDLVKLCAKD